MIHVSLRGVAQETDHRHVEESPGDTKHLAKGDQELSGIRVVGFSPEAFRS